MAAKPASIEAFEWQLNLREKKHLNGSEAFEWAAKPARIEAFEWQLNLQESKLLNDS